MKRLFLAKKTRNSLFLFFNKKAILLLKKNEVSVKEFYLAH